MSVLLRSQHQVLTHCTIQLESGDFCDAASLDDAPFPICRWHAEALIAYYLPKSDEQRASEAKARIDDFREAIGIARQTYEINTAAEARALNAQSVVYYVDLGDRIKIGTTISTIERMRQLRVDMDALLATEPGNYELETMRHRQFVEARIGRREDFEKTPELLSHIQMIKNHFGEPVSTKRFKVLDES